MVEVVTDLLKQGSLWKFDWNRRLNKEKCLGLLGFAGNYEELDRGTFFEALNFVICNYDIIDISCNYGAHFNLMDILIGSNPSESEARYVVKVGGNDTEPYDVKE